MQFILDTFKRLTSRKFLLTLSAALVLVANQQWTELVALISGYTFTEGTGDIVSRYQGKKLDAAKLELKANQLAMGEYVGNLDNSDFGSTGVISGKEVTDPRV